MKVAFVSIKNAVLDFITDTGMSHDEVDEPLLLKWASDSVKWFNTDQQLRHRIAVLQVQNSRAELPADYKILAQAAAKPHVYDPCDCSVDPDQECCMGKPRHLSPIPSKTRRETIIQWVQKSMHDDCQIEINLRCPKCHQTSCDHRVVEVDVDRAWEMAHPELYYGHFTRIGRFGYGNTPGSAYSPEFQLMRMSTSDFFNASAIITGCPNLGCVNCEHEFIIELPYIEVDFEKGEVLVSYLGKVLDDDGEVMIPDHPDAFEAVFHHLRYKWNMRKSDSSSVELQQLYMSKAMQSKQLRDEAIMFAKQYLQMPSAQEWKSWLQNSSWLHRIPNWSMDNAGRRLPDQHKNYLE